MGPIHQGSNCVVCIPIILAGGIGISSKPHVNQALEVALVGQSIPPACDRSSVSREPVRKRLPSIRSRLICPSLILRLFIFLFGLIDDFRNGLDRSDARHGMASTQNSGPPARTL